MCGNFYRSLKKTAVKRKKEFAGDTHIQKRIVPKLKKGKRNSFSSKYNKINKKSKCSRVTYDMANTKESNELRTLKKLNVIKDETP